MSTWAPLGSPCLTNSEPDTWHTVSHLKCVKCPALPRCLEKREIPTVSEFDVVARFETIPTVKSVSLSEI